MLLGLRAASASKHACAGSVFTHFLRPPPMFVAKLSNASVKPAANLRIQECTGLVYACCSDIARRPGTYLMLDCVLVWQVYGALDRGY